MKACIKYTSTRIQANGCTHRQQTVTEDVKVAQNICTALTEAKHSNNGSKQQEPATNVIQRIKVVQ